MSPAQILELIKPCDGSQVRVAFVEHRDERHCVVGFQMRGMMVYKSVYLGDSISDFSAYLRRAGREAERDLTIRLAEEAERSDTQ